MLFTFLQMMTSWMIIIIKFLQHEPLHWLLYHFLLNADYQQQQQKELFKKSHMLAHKLITEWGFKLLKDKRVTLPYL